MGAHRYKHRYTYVSWAAMVARCHNPKCTAYTKYGARGISVCPQWMDFDNFYRDMGPRPKGTSIDRYPNQSGNYEPGNCRWATPKEQGNNSRNNRIIEHAGLRATVSQWADLLGIQNKTLEQRFIRGWSVKRALFTKVRPQHESKFFPKRTLRRHGEQLLMFDMSGQVAKAA